ncbi:MAG: type II/IV secretion system ATPase subunit [Candidatus Heimdallarchaeota archaeon]
MATGGQPGQSSSLIRETYPLIPPFAYALIQSDPETQQVKYTIVEVPLSSKEEEYTKMISDLLIEELDVDFDTLRDKKKAQDYLRSKIMDIVKKYGIKVDEKGFDKILYHLHTDFLGFGKIEPLLKDHSIEDISCDGTGIPVYVWHRIHESIPTNIDFSTHDELDSFVIKLAQRAGRHISVAHPLLDAALPDGSRLQLSLGKEVTMKGSTFTIRKFRSDPLTISDMIAFNTIDEQIGAFCWFALEFRKSILISGGTAAGKTSMLNSLAMFIRPGMKIVSIEDTAELNIPHENWIPSVARAGFGAAESDGKRRGEVSMFDLLRASLRQRPDYLFVGEVRGDEAYIMFQAMSTGHTAMGTIHGDSTVGVLRRLESAPMNIPRTLLQALNLVMVQRRVRRAERHVRRTVEILEIVGVDPVTNEIVTNKIHSWNPRDDSFTFFGRSYILEDIMAQTGWSEGEIYDELDRRQTILRWMVKKKVNHYQEVGRILQRYYQNPEQLVDEARRELKSL